MAKSLRSMNVQQRELAITRRLKSDTKGLGYWAAVDAKAKIQKIADLIAEKKAKRNVSG